MKPEGPECHIRKRAASASERMLEEFAAMLCRIERHLHGGAQDRLVTMAMRLSVIREQLASATGPGAEAARELLDAVHLDATRAMAELRDLARGIRPPALDGGLGPAINSLTAHSPVPIDLHVGMTDRPSASIEAVVYFCAAELLADIREHGEASYACIEIAQRDQSLLLQVTYDAAGEVAPEQRSGLASAANYVRSVDGTLSVHSQKGGPTLVTAVLPFRV
jgi:signal transduction histidine kinase